MITIDDFPRFYEAIHQRPPFAWQTRLTNLLIDGWFPDVVDLPTSAGKTSLIDAALFALATQGNSSNRSMPRRIIHVIDRRTVVDQTARHIEKIGIALIRAWEHPEQADPILSAVVDRLREFSGTAPLHTARLRGGVARTTAWASDPCTPLLAVSTVDQIGSQVLFRGYGLSPYRWPIHAGLAGMDTLYLVDEAHISEPFVETLRSIARIQAEATHQPTLPLRVMSLSATTTISGARFQLDSDERVQLADRLTAEKRATLESVPNSQFENACVEQALAFAELGARVIGVVVNQVKTARGIHTKLQKKLGKRDDSKLEPILLTGRARVWERDRLLEKNYDVMRAGRKTNSSSPFFVVATQTIEVGADLDFDALVTESAPLDALRQRFGRLNRLGQLLQRCPELEFAPAAILHRDTGGKSDPVYGDLSRQTFLWLNSLRLNNEAGIDFGISSFEALLERAIAEEKEVPRTEPLIPVLRRAHVRMFCQTSPVPVPCAEPAPFLHGPQSGPADVHIVWRADLGEDTAELWQDIVALAPPTPGEYLTLSLAVARAWLLRTAIPPLADIEGIHTGSQVSNQTGTRKALDWRGVEGSMIVEPQQIKPGTVLVVPASYGGVDKFGWNPDSSTTVLDIGDVCAANLPRKRLRLSKAYLRNQIFPEGQSPNLEFEAIMSELQNLGLIQGEPQNSQEASTDTSTEFDVERFKATVLTPLQALAPSDEFRNQLAMLSRQRISHPRFAIADKTILSAVVETGPVDTDPEDDDRLSFLGQEAREIPLSEHNLNVGVWARRFANECGLNLELQEDLQCSGEQHDIGKADPRMQVMFYRGDAVRFYGEGILLAKSGLDLRNRKACEAARKAAGYPKGYRHELLSVALLKAAPSLLDNAHDPELVRYLVGTHHGRARPIPPVTPRENPTEVSITVDSTDVTVATSHSLERLDSGWPDLFWTLNARYGPWGLAFLEAILRLADHNRSREEQEPQPTASQRGNQS